MHHAATIAHKATSIGLYLAGRAELAATLLERGYRRDLGRRNGSRKDNSNNRFSLVPRQRGCQIFDFTCNSTDQGGKLGFLFTAVFVIAIIAAKCSFLCACL